MFKGVLIEKDDQGYRANIKELEDSILAEGDTVVNVSYSTLNYKDALAITGKSPIIRSFPLIPGIDLVGTVESCTSGKFAEGDKVLLNGFGVGEGHNGGLSQKAKLKSEWLIPLPNTITEMQAMAIGTAGYTAMLCVMALEKNGLTPESGEILVTGANGGVGSYAVAILSKLGYNVVASTGRVDESAYLTKLGASEIIDRNTLSEPGRPLAKERWAGVVDYTLVNACAATKSDGVVTACGLAQGMDLPGTVAPFILRGVSLVGINSVYRSLEDRTEAWERLGEILDAEIFNDISKEISLTDVVDTAEALIAGKVQGRVIVSLA